MIWTVFQIAVSRTIGETMDSILTPIPYNAAVGMVDHFTGNTFERIGRILHYPEELMYDAMGYVLEQTVSVVDEVNQTGLNLLDAVYSGIYD